MAQGQRVVMVMAMGNKKGNLLIFNSLSGVVQLLLTGILLFICIPIFISSLGNEQYGIFSLVSVIGNLAVFANLSLDATLIKFLSEQGKCKESDYDIIIGILLMSLILIPISICLYLLKEPILIHVLNIPQDYLPQSLILFSYLVFSNLLLILGKIFTAMLDSMNKIYLTNFFMFIYSVIYWGGIILVILAGYGLSEIGLVILVATLIWFSLVLFFSLKYWGLIHHSGISIHYKGIVKKQLNYTIKIYTGSLLAFFQEPLTKVLIANFIGVSFVGIYEIALKVKNQLFSVFIKIMHPLFPLVANLKDPGQVRVVIVKSTELLFYFAIPIVLLFLLYTPSIVGLWINGVDDVLISESLIILIFFNILFSVTVVPIYLYIRAKNHPEKEIVIQAIFTIVNLLIIILFYNKIGYYSILLSNSIAITICFVYCISLYRKYLKVLPFKGQLAKTKYLLVLITVTLLFLAIYFCCDNRNWLIIILKTFAMALASLGIFYKLKIFRKEDIKYFTS